MDDARYHSLLFAVVAHAWAFNRWSRWWIYIRGVLRCVENHWRLRALLDFHALVMDTGACSDCYLHRRLHCGRCFACFDSIA
jgi:hypothetical protein